MANTNGVTPNAVNPCHWRNEFKSNYFGSHLMPGNSDVVLTIKKVQPEDLMSTDGSKKHSLVCYWEENQLPMVLNKTNCRVIAKMYHENDYTRWTGKRLQIYVDHNVKAFGDTVDGLRIRPKVPEEVKIACSECGQYLTPGFGMTPSQLAAYTKQKYKRCLCAECAQSAAKGGKKDKEGN